MIVRTKRKSAATRQLVVANIRPVIPRHAPRRLALVIEEWRCRLYEIGESVAVQISELPSGHAGHVHGQRLKLDRIQVEAE